MIRFASFGLMALIGSVLLAHDGPYPHSHGEPVSTGVSSQVEFTVRGEFRYVPANGLPNHQTGAFPNRGNPNAIRPQRYQFRMPAEPAPTKQTTSLEHNLFGVALNGVVFDPGTAEFWRNDPRWNYEALSGRINLGLDQSNAHVQPTGAYHYHGIPQGLVESLGGDRDQMRLVGYAADGFPIYSSRAYQDPQDSSSELVTMRSSYRVRQGNRPGGPGGAYDGTFVADYEYVPQAGDLDECNGRTGVTPEYPQGTYYYVLTDTFPFIPRAFRGEPDASFNRRGPGGGMPPPGGRPGPPPGGRPPPRF